jgi:TRAP transporter TAXI family solute receptor
MKQRGALGIAGVATAAAVVVFLGFFVAYQFVDPAPPRRITMATGPDGGAYQQYGKQFASYLAREGITVELQNSAGSVENLQALQVENGVDIAFVQGGLSSELEGDTIVALGSLYFEPLWVFVDSDAAIATIADMAGKRLAIGAEGSGTRPAVRKLLVAHGIDESNTEFSGLEPLDIPAAFADQQLDAAFIIGAPESQLVRQLVTDKGMRLLGLENANAYVRLYPYVSKLTLPAGVLDLKQKIPATDITTVALTAMLVARQDLHPALVDLLLVAATDIHGGHSLLADRGDFPTPRYVDLPLSNEADRHFRHGSPFLMLYLPFWAATAIDRLWVMLLPLIGLAIPLVKLVPAAYQWRIRRRLLRMYSDLESLDPQFNPVAGDDDIVRRLDALAELDNRSLFTSVPREYKDDVYKLRRDIDLVRRHLKGGGAAPADLA